MSLASLWPPQTPSAYYVWTVVGSLMSMSWLSYALRDVKERPSLKQKYYYIADGGSILAYAISLAIATVAHHYTRFAPDAAALVAVSSLFIGGFALMDYSSCCRLQYQIGTLREKLSNSANENRRKDADETELEFFAGRLKEFRVHSAFYVILVLIGATFADQVF